MSEVTALSATDADAAYADFLHRSHLQFHANLKQSNSQLFKTNADVTFDKYLALLPDGVRQYHTCSACRDFVDHYGSLVAINEQGELIPAMWEPGAAFNVHEIQEAVTALYNAVKKARVTGVFYSKEATLGTPSNYDEKRGCTWHHMSATLPPEAVYKSDLLTAGQHSAEKKEEYGMVCRALSNYSEFTLRQAVTLLSADTFYSSESVLGQAQWLLDLFLKRSALSGPRKEHVTWVAVAKAPAGFCHPSTSMIGTLLDDLNAGLPVSEVKRKFDAKMHPLRYQRPQAEPKLGNIEQAEKVVETLGLTKSLQRRFARLDEIQTIWTPAQPDAGKQGGGVFQHLKPNGKRSDKMVIPQRRMTWAVFSRDVLPQARGMELLVPSHGNFAAMTTCQHEDAPPLLQWDGEPRNPVSWYLYHAGSNASRWGLAPNYTTVVAVSEQPSMWHEKAEKFKHHGKSLFFILKGCADTVTNELAIFPSLVRSELHGHRSVIEAYSKSKALPKAPSDVQMASGMRFQGEKHEAVMLRVDIGDGALHDIIVDRWE